MPPSKKRAMAPNHPFVNMEHVNISYKELPIAWPPSNLQPLKQHSNQLDVFRVVAVPESGLLATASDDGLRIFSLGGDGQPLHFCAGARNDLSAGLAALGGDVIACGCLDGTLRTWRASTGELLETIKVGAGGGDAVAYVWAMAALGPAAFVVGTGAGTLIFFSHEGGRSLCEVARREPLRAGAIYDIVVDGDVIVAVSSEKVVAVWSASKYERVAVYELGVRVWCAAVGERSIALGLADGSILVGSILRMNALHTVIERVHKGAVVGLAFAHGDFLLSVSFDKTAAITSLSEFSPAKVVARVDIGFATISTEIMPNGRIACVGSGGIAGMFSPYSVAEEFQTLAKSLPRAGAGKPSASGAAAIVPALPPAKKQRVQKSIDGSSFQLKELKAAASNAKRVVTMNNEELSRVLAAVMFGFREESRSHLAALATALETAFGNLHIYSDAIVEFPVSVLVDLIMRALKKSGAYSFEDSAASVPEWRLRCFLYKLRA